MIILDEKMPLTPPPPYIPPEPLSPPPFPHATRLPPKLGTLPPHLILRIVYGTFSRNTSIAKQRKALYWLTGNLRLVNRTVYIACMHILRITYLSSYTELIRKPYTSGPFPLTSSTPLLTLDPTASPTQSLHRETRVLDLFIALKVREDVWADDTELHLERDESFRDVFDLMQPRSRLEDLIRVYGLREGVVSIPAPSPAIQKSAFNSNANASMLAGALATPSAPAAVINNSRYKFTPIPFPALSISFSSRRVGLVLTTRERRRTICEVERTRDERLEVAAKRLVDMLRDWIANNPNPGIR